jgi:hypothetical protein
LEDVRRKLWREGRVRKDGYLLAFVILSITALAGATAHARRLITLEGRRDQISSRFHDVIAIGCR